MKEAEHGIAVVCDQEGIVRRVLRNDLGHCALPGQSLLQLADPVDLQKAREFFLTLKTRGPVSDWQIFARCNGVLRVLYFSGYKMDALGFVVVAAPRRQVAQMLQSEAIREGRSEEASGSGPRDDLLPKDEGVGSPVDREVELYDELSRVNNELANLHRDLCRKNAELAKLNEQKTEFLGVAAHELRSPLSVILTYSEFLEEEAPLPKEQHEFAAVIKNTSGFLLRLINNLLDVSQIEAGKLTLELRPTDLGELARRNVGLNAVLAGKKRIRITFSQESPIPGILLDPGKIEQVLNNLLGNAIKFSPPESEISVRLSREGDQAVIAVKDQGPGIPEKEQDKLFKPFSCIRVKSTAGERGTGLGLSIARRIVEGHHGTVKVKSQLGKGSDFQVRLPMTTSEEADPQRSKFADPGEVGLESGVGSGRIPPSSLF